MATGASEVADELEGDAELQALAEVLEVPAHLRARVEERRWLQREIEQYEKVQAAQRRRSWQPHFLDLGLAGTLLASSLLPTQVLPTDSVVHATRLCAPLLFRLCASRADEHHPVWPIWKGHACSS